MTVKREDLDHARIVCTRQARRRCYVCRAAATVLCDHPGEGEGGMCSRPCCQVHARYWTRGKDVCEEHARQLGCW